MKLSIIIPVYNVERYVEKCIRSVELQNIVKKDYEVLVYDDGSKDSSLSIVEQIAKEYTNIIIKSHPNKGLSATRNRGIQEAQGDFIWFVDSDDWLEENCLYSIMTLLKDDVDILSFNGFIPEGKRVELSTFYGDDVNDREKLLSGLFFDAAQFYIYRRNFLRNNNLFFKEGIKHEDTLFTPIVLHNAKKIVFYRKPVYHFLQREGSITMVVDVKRVNDLADNMAILYDYSHKIDEPTVKKGFYNHMAHHITEMMNYGIDNRYEGEALVQQIMKNNPVYWDIMLNAIDRKPRFIARVVKYSPFPFIMTYRIMAKVKSSIYYVSSKFEIKHK